MENEKHRQQRIIKRKILTMKERYQEIRIRQIQLIEKTTNQIKSLDPDADILDDVFVRDFEANTHRTTLDKLKAGKLKENDSIEGLTHLRKGVLRPLQINSSSDDRLSKRDKSMLKNTRRPPWPITKANSVEELEVTGPHSEMPKPPRSAPKQRIEHDQDEVVKQKGATEQKSVPQSVIALPKIEGSTGGKDKTITERQSESKFPRPKMSLSLPLLGPHMKKKNRISGLEKAQKSTVELSKECLSEIIMSAPKYMNAEEKQNHAMEIFKQKKKNDEKIEMRKITEKIVAYNKEVYSFTHPPQKSKWNRLKATVSIMKGFGLKLGKKNVNKRFNQRMVFRY